ncbi:MAG: DUF2607 domain-containing protein [Pseudomonadales bacterium]|nr:DUF2607 domain-containing protein [Pseudomonadales bacterium]NRA15844.1 DUF2607 family protein [Oceanospirillaceae bacterium]
MVNPLLSIKYFHCALALLLLLLNFSVIAHQTDNDAAHHAEHQCSLFNACADAISGDVTSTELSKARFVTTPERLFHSPTVTIYQLQARGPPLLS